MPTEGQQLATAVGLESDSGRVSVTPPPAESSSHGEDVARELYGGRNLDEHTREAMESQFGEDFSDVRVHTDYSAATTAESLQSRAFTVGSDIVFAEGEFAPETTEGRRLLAHELAHVVQQRQPTGPIAGEKDAERDAREAAREVTSGGTPAVRERATPGTVQKAGTPVGVFANYDFPGVVTIFATNPDDPKFPDPVVELFDESDSLVVAGASGVEHGGDSGHDTLTIRVSVMGTVSGTKTTPTSRWKHIAEPIITTVPSSLPIPAPELPKPAPRPRTAPPQQKPVPKKEQPRVTPAPERPAPEPQPVEPQPAEPQPSRDIKIAGSQPSAATKLHQVLAEDPAKAPEAAAKMTDQELADLEYGDRLRVIQAIAQFGGATDTTTLTRLITNTPNQDAGALHDALEADNGKLLRDFYPRAGIDAWTQIAFTTMDLSARRTDRPLFSLLATPQFDMPRFDMGNPFQDAPRDPREVIFVGDKSMQPSWMKGLKYWKDAKGNTNIESPEMGLATWDRSGKRIGLPPPGWYDAERAVRGSLYLAQTGGRRYVQGKGWLDEAAWKEHLQQEADAVTAEQSRQYENLKGGVEQWNKTQEEAAPAPKYLSHLFGGVSIDAPSKIAARTAQDIDIGRNEILKARTPEELAAAKRFAMGVTRFGEYQFSQHKEELYIGGDRTIVAIKVGAAAATAYVSAPVLLSGGGVALSVKGVAIGAAGGGGLSAARQGVEMWQGTRTEFSGWEVGGGALTGAGLVFVPEAAPLLLGMNVGNAADEFAQGQYKLAAFDTATSFAPIAAKGAPAALRYARPRIAGAYMRLSIGTELGMSGGGRYSPSIVMEPRIVLVDVAGRPVSSTPARAPAAAPNPGPTTQAATPAAPVWATPEAGSVAPGFVPYNLPFTVSFATPAPSQNAADAAFDQSFDATFSQAPVGTQGVFQTAPRLARGNLGERLGTEALASMGHTILMYKPDILGTNQGGIDMVTRHNGVLHLVDNKALTRSGNVSSVSALTTNFTQNLAQTRAEFAQAAADPARPPAVRAIFQQAVNDIDSGNYVRVVTNANVSPDNQVPTGVTQNLTNQGIGFINVR